MTRRKKCALFFLSVKVRQGATRAALAAIFHRQGKLERALEYFQAAENMHKRVEPTRFLHSVPGVYYCALLLDMATHEEQEEVLQRAEKILKDYPHSKRYPLMHALHHLNKGLVLTELRRWDAAGWALEDALERINKNYKLQFACPPLLARATYWRLRGASGKARADLEQVLRNWQVTARELHLLRCITSTQSVRSTSSNLTSCGTHSYWRTWPLCAHSLSINSLSIYRREIQIHPV